MSELVKFDAMKRAIAAAQSVDEVKQIRDKAAALRAYMRQAGEGLEAQNRVAEIKIRAERRAGELLSVMEKAKGTRLNGTRRYHDDTAERLADVGLTKLQSHRWQRMAAVPEKSFASYVAETIEAGRELTSKAIYKLGMATVETKPIRRAKPIAGVVEDLAELGGQKFGTIYADPPWQYDNSSTRANVEGLYAGTMSVDDVCAMPVEQLAADDAHCHLWTTNAFLRDAFRVLDAWGFEYRSVFVWVKPQMGIGNYWRVSHEFLLLGIRGNAKRFERHDFKSWGEFDRGEHSAKPEAIRGMIEQVSPGPHLELFGRQQIPGWMVFGNQVSEQRRFA